ncbi:hypothetical protein PFICI_00165 [Pestalotiopsis fici W106-1]|uniref:Uncharacterized protein n=1 Tax=Pestalotiopsis fici (strain W106-1 / CGMCC3.15140) TaxID=1229662 RepID=W3XLK1_PESFW|nr:uncharacterized protein PFICI_00165 [Pestalotiopsis fici W106-1]ETS86337.1 hypothetical protein PFICI_00165 [Pestalotiopsis fici W106-1]
MSMFRLDSQVRRTQQDEHRAQELMNAQNPHSNSDFTYKEATAVLELIAEGTIANVTPGLVEVLLEDFDADVNLKRRKSNSLWKRMSDKDQEDIRSKLLEKAAQNCSSEILLLLAQYADEVAVNQALPHAIAQNNLNKVSILLARGGDATSLCSQFAQVLESGSDEIITKLMNRNKGACQACRDKGLVRAAELGFTTKARILLENGANIMFGNAAALSAAVRRGCDDIASPIALRGVSSIPKEVLDGVLGDAYQKGMLRTVVSCLQAGAKGSRTDATLTEAVRHGQFELVSNLVQHGAAVNHSSGSAVVCAVESGRPEMLRTILAGKPSLESMAAAMMQSAKLGNIQSCQQMIGLLLAAGFRGEATSLVLIQVMDKKQIKGEERIRLGLVHLLLTKGNADVNLRAGCALGIAAAEGWMGILDELLQSRPSFESRVSVLRSAMKLQPAARKRVVGKIFEGVRTDQKLRNQVKDAAVTLAAKSLHLDVLTELTQYGLDEVTVQAGFDAVVSTGTAWMSAAGLQVVQFFLNKGASGQSVEHAFYEAATVAEMDAFDLLSTSITSISVLNTALTGVARQSKKWLSLDDRTIWLVDSLLAWGAHGDCVNLAFLAALRAYTTGGASTTVLDLLLKVGKADVNFQHGEALKIAVRSGDVPLVTHLASNGASQETMTHAFWETISSPLEEDTALKLINALVSGKDRVSKPTLSVVLPDRWPHVFECLTAHPNSAKLVKRLAELGCDMDAEIVTQLYDDVKERANALSWALRPCRGVPIISTEAIGALIDLKVNVCFTAPFSKATPVILAAKHCRGEVVKKLIKAGADPSLRDRDNRAAIFHASSAGDLESVKVLLKSKYRPNDGSLHEAARNLHSDVVAALIKGEYDVNFPSSRLEHEGRTPLQELAYRCRGVDRIQDTEETIMALKKGKADALKKWHGKTCLFLALDNEYPLEVTRALLDMIMWDYMDSLDNVLATTDAHTGVTFFRSATKYLTDYKENSKQTFQLLQLLQTKGCVDRYYAQFGAMQPPNAVGFPEDIAKEEKRYRAEVEKTRKSEAEHQEKLRRIQEESHLKLTIDESKHEAWKNHEYQKAIHKVGSSAIVHENELHQKAQLTEQQRLATAQKHALMEQDRHNLEIHKQRTAAISQMKIAGEQQIKLNYAQRTADQKMEAQKNQLYYAKKADTQRIAAQNAQNNLKKQANQQQIATQHAQNNLKKQANKEQIAMKKKLQAMKH